MFFLPYKLDHAKHGIAFFTLTIISICVFLFFDQVKSESDYNSKLNAFCSSLSSNDKSFIQELSDNKNHNNCHEEFEKIRSSSSPEEELRKLALEAPRSGLFSSPESELSYTVSKLEELYGQFKRQVPENLTAQLAYDPSNINWVKMLTSTIAHADAFHLFGNLLFFYIFSSAVELLIGSFLYLVFFFATTVTTSLAYSYATAGIEEALPTIGLSGVVMGTLAALAILAPMARIKCFLWIVVFFKTFTLPALLIATWYIGWDLYEMRRFGLDSPINYVAHISGAFTGALFAIVIIIAEKKRPKRL